MAGIITHLGRLTVQVSRNGRRRSYTGLYGVTDGLGARGGIVTVDFDTAIPTADGRTHVNGVTFGVVAAGPELRQALQDLDRAAIGRRIARYVIEDLKS